LAMGGALFFILGGVALGASLDNAPSESASAAQNLVSGFWPELWRVMTLRDYNTRVVIIGATFLGIAAGLVGTFLLLRKRSLLSDALSHATLPGVVLAFMAMIALGGAGRNLVGLLAGAAIFAVLGILAVGAIRKGTRLADDAALGIVLSVFFGAGIALLTMASRMESGHSAGLNSFIYGKTSSMLYSDALLIAISAAAAAVVCVLFFKEFAMICFDQNFAAAQGWPVFALDLLMMLLVVGVTVIGLQAVGLILVVAMLVIPAAAARFWTNNLRRMLATSALLGGVSAFFGSAASALFERLPAGAVIVLAAAIVFFISLLIGPARGLIRRTLEHARLSALVARQHLLRELLEAAEIAAQTEGSSEERAAQKGVAFHELLGARSWRPRALHRALSHAIAAGFIAHDENRFRLTAEGLREARAVVRNHRLWEIYLITHADIAPSHVETSADRIEHVLDPELIRRLEILLAEKESADAEKMTFTTKGAKETKMKMAKEMPPSPHALVAAPISPSSANEARP